MSKKREIHPRETYVLDDEDLQELDDASLTGVMRDLTSTLKIQSPDDEVSDEDADEDSGLDFGILDKEDL